MTEKRAEDKGPEKEQVEDEPSLPVADLIEGARSLFGVSPHLAAGALSKGNRKHYTVSEASQAVRDFAEREIK